jgi:hypothetical protein
MPAPPAPPFTHLLFIHAPTSSPNPSVEQMVSSDAYVAFLAAFFAAIFALFISPEYHAFESGQLVRMLTANAEERSPERRAVVELPASQRQRIVTSALL